MLEFIMKKNNSLGKLRLGLNKHLHLAPQDAKPQRSDQNNLYSDCIREEEKMKISFSKKDVLQPLQQRKRACTVDKYQLQLEQGKQKYMSHKENILSKSSKIQLGQGQNQTSLKTKLNLVKPTKTQPYLNLGSNADRKTSFTDISKNIPSLKISSKNNEIEETQKPILNNLAIENIFSIVKSHEDKKKDKLNFFSSFSQNFRYQKQEKLSINSNTLQYIVQFDSEQKEKQLFKDFYQKIYQNNSLSQQQLKFLFDHSKILSTKIQDLSKESSNLERELLKQNDSIEQNKKQMQRLDIQITTKKKQLSRFEQKLSQMKSFIKEQPNQFLQILVSDYKKYQQELFDLAEFLQTTRPEKIDLWIGQTIKLADRNHQLYIQQLGDRSYDKDGKCTVTKKEIKHLQERLKESHCEMITNFDKIFDERVKRIHQFILLMEKLATATLAKRDYLDQINQKAMGVSNILESLVQNLQLNIAVAINDFMVQNKIDSDFQELKTLISQLSDLYIKAQIFY